MSCQSLFYRFRFSPSHQGVETILDIHTVLTMIGTRRFSTTSPIERMRRLLFPGVCLDWMAWRLRGRSVRLPGSSVVDRLGTVLLTVAAWPGWLPCLLGWVSWLGMAGVLPMYAGWVYCWVLSLGLGGWLASFGCINRWRKLEGRSMAQDMPTSAAAALLCLTGY